MLRNKRRATEAAGVIVLLLILGAQLVLTVRQQSQTWDEADHIFAGYLSWKTGDFGLNPEHPPLAKLLATMPLLPIPLALPELQNRDFKEEAFLSGKDFLYRNDADSILIRVRLAAAILTLLCALLVFAGTKEMFGTGAAFVALTLLAFDPNLIAHGAYVTTDAGASCFMFATIYAFYRYVKAPSWQRLILVGLALGIALAIKHSAVLLFPMLLLLAIIELLRQRFAGKDSQAAKNLGKPALKFVLSLAAVTVISLVLLWVFYGFRYQARPNGLQLNPTFAEYTQRLKPSLADQHHGANAPFARVVSLRDG
jgi:dolichyl-phosphate-mannose--protein O-mannosyl transferase